MCGVGFDKEQRASHGGPGVPQPGEQRRPVPAWHQVHSHASQQTFQGDGAAVWRREGSTHHHTHCPTAVVSITGALSIHCCRLHCASSTARWCSRKGMVLRAVHRMVCLSMSLLEKVSWDCSCRSGTPKTQPTAVVDLFYNLN